MSLSSRSARGARPSTLPSYQSPMAQIRGLTVGLARHRDQAGPAGRRGPRQHRATARRSVEPGEHDRGPAAANSPRSCRGCTLSSAPWQALDRTMTPASGIGMIGPPVPRTPVQEDVVAADFLDQVELGKNTWWRYLVGIPLSL